MPRSQRETKSAPARPGRKTPQAKQTQETPEEHVVEATTDTTTQQTATRAKPTHQAATHQPTRKTTTTKTATQDTVSNKETANRETKSGRGQKTAAGKDDPRAEFIAAQKAALLAERATYLKQADELKAQADSLALEHEPGDVQFDEEGGEGGTSNVDRELDLLLSAQARASITEIDVALAKIENGTYGLCEQCGAVIPEARLEALPHASLCVSCKNGGLSSRR